MALYRKGMTHGLYRIYWKSGGISLASVGFAYDGSNWFAPCNWTSSKDNIDFPLVATTDWSGVEKAELIIANDYENGNKPSPDIQKRAEELWPIKMGTKPKEILRKWTKVRYDENEKERAKAIQLATELQAKHEEEIREMREAFDEIANPIKYMRQRLKDGEQLDGVGAAFLSDNATYLKEIAKRQVSKLQQRIKELENN